MVFPRSLRMCLFSRTLFQKAASRAPPESGLKDLAGDDEFHFKMKRISSLWTHTTIALALATSSQAFGHLELNVFYSGDTLKAGAAETSTKTFIEGTLG